MRIEVFLDNAEVTVRRPYRNAKSLMLTVRNGDGEIVVDVSMEALRDLREQIDTLECQERETADAGTPAVVA